MMSTVETNWLEKVEEMVQYDEYFQELNKQWEDGILAPELHQKKHGIFYYRNKILLNPASDLTHLLISEHHKTPTGRHSGYEKMLQRLKKIVYWKGIRIV